MVKKSRKNRRGVPNGVQKHKISFRREHLKKESNLFSSILTGSKRQIAHFVSVCWNNGFGYSSLLSLIPFERKKSTGSFQSAPLHKRTLHYTLVAFYGLILVYKFYAAIINASTNGPGLVTYLSFLSFIASLVGSCSAVGSTWLSGQMCAVLNSWQPLLRGLNEETGSRRTSFDNSGVNLKAAITFVTCSLAGIDVALFSLIDDLPVCVLPALTSFGAVNLSQQSSILMRIAFLPLELLVMVPPMFTSGLSGMTAMIGIGVFKLYLQEVRRLQINDKKSWNKVYKLYRAIQMYNGVFMTWFKYMIVPVLFGCSCGIILLVYITIRPSGLHPFIYCWFPIITVVLVINITLLCYDCVTIKRLGDEVLESLQSKMHVHQLGLMNVDKQDCVRMGKSLRSVYLAIGDFSEITLEVPTGSTWTVCLLIIIVRKLEGARPRAEANKFVRKFSKIRLLRNSAHSFRRLWNALRAVEVTCHQSCHMNISGSMESERWRTDGYLIAEDIGMSSVPGNTRVILTVDDNDCCAIEEDFIRLCCLSVPGGDIGPDWNRFVQEDQSIRLNLMKETVALLCERLLKPEGKMSAPQVEDFVKFKLLIQQRMQHFHEWKGGDLENNYRTEFEEEMEQVISQVKEFLDEDFDQDSEESQTDLIERCISFCTSGLTSGVCDQCNEDSKWVPQQTFQQQPSRYEQERGMQTEAESVALKILSKFPLGLGLDALVGHLKALLPVNAVSEDDQLKENLCKSRFFKALSNGKHSVVLPGTNIRSLNEIERSLYSLISIVVKVSNASVPVTELPSRLITILGVRFSPSHWEISRPEDFYQQLFDTWGLNESVIGKGKSDGSTMEGSSKVIQWICSSMKENDWSYFDDKNLWCTPRPRRPSDGPFPEDFVSLDHSVVSVADMLEPEKVYLVRPDFMLSPIQFYVSMFENAELRDIFVDEMTKFYNRWKEHLRGRIWPQIIQEGSLVAVKFDNQWHRGLVMRLCRSNNSRLRLTINLFDIGECIEKVSCRNVYPVHKDFASEPQQTFMCRLPLKELDKHFHISAGKKWFTQSALEDFYDILQDKVIAIIPHRRVLEENCWEVSVLLTEDSSAGKNSIVGDLLTMFIAQQCGHDDDEDTSQEKNSIFVEDFNEFSASQQSPDGNVRSRHEDNNEPKNVPVRGAARQGRGWGWYQRLRGWGRQ